MLLYLGNITVAVVNVLFDSYSENRHKILVTKIGCAMQHTILFLNTSFGQDFGTIVHIRC